MKDTAGHAGRPLGDLLQDFVTRVAHRGGRTLSIMNETSVTLQQVILLNRIAEAPQVTSSELAGALGMSLTSISQMIDRLHRIELVSRAEMSADRRKKQIALTEAGRALLDRLREARSLEFEVSVAALSPQIRADLSHGLAQALRELDHGAGALQADTPVSVGAAGW
ncbi:MAG TPA: MarR family transcriptional regulator [Caulobacteraceae bacterium]|jgi:DNA-binding MarR family transcriptional regulator|nr:MarR family transcriptional regulator [Caulobacteraceae bacterium]